MNITTYRIPALQACSNNMIVSVGEGSVNKLVPNYSYIIISWKAIYLLRHKLLPLKLKDLCLATAWHQRPDINYIYTDKSIVWRSCSTQVQRMELTLELLENITNSFSEEHKIGYGGYGIVYKVHLTVVFRFF